MPSVSGVTVITNSVDAMACLSGYDVKAYCTGGLVSSENRAVLVGGYAQNFLSQIHSADVVLFSVQALTEDGNFYDCYAEEVAVRNIMLKNARRKILLIDSSKLGRPSTFYQGNVRDLDYVVSDRDLCAFFTDPIPEKLVLSSRVG